MRLAPSVPAAFELALLGRARSVGLMRAGDVTLADRSLTLAPGARSVKLKPNRRLLGGTRRFTVQLRVVATDAAGNRRTLTRSIRVR